MDYGYVDSALKGNFTQPEIITGKPLAIGGSLAGPKQQVEDCHLL